MKFFAVFAFSMGYAAFRYLVFGPVAMANLPCFIVNKAVSLASVLALCAAAIQARAGRGDQQRAWFAFFKVTLFLHLALSFFLFSSDYYPTMFSGGKMNLSGELFMLCGVLALFMLMLKTIVKEAGIGIEILQPLSLVAIALHNLFLGVGNWPKWRAWYGYMPPITMISFIAAIVALLFTVAPRPKAKA